MRTVSDTTGSSFLSQRLHPPNAEMLNIIVCTYLFSILCSIRYSSIHGGRYYKITFVINGIFFPAGKWEGGFSSRCNEGETKPLLEDGDCWSEPRGGLLRDGMRAGQTTTGWAFFVATLSLSFTHSVTPLHALASGCLEPSGGWGWGLVNSGWTHSGNYFFFGPVALPIELIPTAEGPATPPDPSVQLACFVWPLVHISTIKVPITSSEKAESLEVSRNIVPFLSFEAKHV